MGNTWEIHGKYMGNTCFQKIHGKYMGNTCEIHAKYIQRSALIPAHMATTCSPMFILSLNSLGKFKIDTDNGHIDFML